MMNENPFPIHHSSFIIHHLDGDALVGRGVVRLRGVHARGAGGADQMRHRAGDRRLGQFLLLAPVDLQQSAIGPGMAVFTRYAKVLDAEGKVLSVREALALINQTLDEVLAEQEGDFDTDSRWALSWFEQFGFGEAEFGTAETLSKAKNTSVGGMVEAGIVASRAGKTSAPPG